MQTIINPIESFLDAADAVLNSNTFLVPLHRNAGDPTADVEAFIYSGGLRRALLEADVARGWYNLHRWGADGELTTIAGKLGKEGSVLTSRKSPYTAVEYLQAMLAANQRLGNFVSFHGCAKSGEEAYRLSRELLDYLFGNVVPELHVYDTDFLQDASGEFDEAYYFEGKGCDNAALLTGEAAGYLLLTNGMP